MQIITFCSYSNFTQRHNFLGNRVVNAVDQLFNYCKLNNLKHVHEMRPCSVCVYSLRSSSCPAVMYAVVKSAAMLCRTALFAAAKYPSAFVCTTARTSSILCCQSFTDCSSAHLCLITKLLWAKSLYIEDISAGLQRDEPQSCTNQTVPCDIYAETSLNRAIFNSVLMVVTGIQASCNLLIVFKFNNFFIYIERERARWMTLTD